jgi:hypothetical protein
MPGDKIRGTGGKGYAHRFCAPTLEDLRELAEEVSSDIERALLEGKLARIGDGRLARSPALFVPHIERLAKIAPGLLYIDPVWRDWLPDIPDSQVMTEEEWNKQHEETEQPTSESTPSDGLNMAGISSHFWKMIGIPEPPGSAKEFRKLHDSVPEFFDCLTWLLDHEDRWKETALKNGPGPLEYLVRSLERDGWIVQNIRAEAEK